MNPLIYQYGVMGTLYEAEGNDVPAQDDGNVVNNTPYKNLTPEEIDEWNRFSVIKEFPDGFKWGYPVDKEGNTSNGWSYGLARKAYDTYNVAAYTGELLWELRGPDNRAYIAIVTSGGKLKRVISSGEYPNMWIRKIREHLKWFLMEKITSVDTQEYPRYIHRESIGIKNFIDSDPEFARYLIEHRPYLIGNIDKRILFWKGALKEHLISVDDLKELFYGSMTMDSLEKRRPRFGTYSGNSPYRRWDDRSGGPMLNIYGILGQHPFEVICRACGRCPFNKQELAALISKKVLSLREIMEYDPSLIDGSIQRALVKADPYNMDNLAKLSSYCENFRLSDDLIDTLASELDNPPADGTRGAKMNEIVGILLSYIDRADIDSARYVRDILFDDPNILHNISPYLRGSLRATNNTTALTLLSVLIRFPDMAIPECVSDGLREMLNSTSVRVDNTMFEKIMRLGTDRLESIMANLSPKQIVRLSLDTSGHLKIDARNILSSAKRLKEVLELVPENKDDVVMGLSAPMKIAYCCISDVGGELRDSAVRSAVSRIQEGEDSPRDKNAMLSAMAAATIMAISSFPEITERLTPVEISDYVLSQADVIEHTVNAGWGQDKSYLTGKLITILMEGFRDTPDDNKRARAAQAITVFDCFVNGMRNLNIEQDVLKPGDQIYNELFYWASRGGTNSFEKLVWGWRDFYPEIPESKWEEYAEHMGKPKFMLHYIVAAVSHDRHKDDARYYDYLARWLADQNVSAMDKYNVFNDKRFRKKEILSKVKEAVLRLAEEGSVNYDMTRYLNERGFLPKSFVDKYAINKFDSQAEEDMDPKDYLQLGNMVKDTAFLKKVIKSKNFPAYLANLFRAVVEYYDRGVQLEPDAENFHAASMYFKLHTLVSFMEDNRKQPGVIAAAKLMMHDGVLDALHIIADRYGENHPIVNQLNGRDVSQVLKEYVDKLDDMARAKQNYRAGDMELPLNRR